MQNDDNNDVDIDLDAFSEELFTGKKPEAKVEDEVEEVAEIEAEDPLATDDDEVEEPDADEDEDQEQDDDEEIEEVPQLKTKRNRAQERIEKLVAEARQAERERDALRIELERIRAETVKEVKAEEAPIKQLPADAPNPEAKDEDGNLVYELGEFDPKFIRDLTKFTIEQETKAAREQAAQEEQARMVAAAQEEIKNKWIDNLDKAEAEIPEIRDNIRTLTETFQEIEPQYGEYLASTIMASDVGPQIMNYLSQNIGEAQKIVASGPHAATLAIGRLEGILTASSKREEKRNTKQVSDAPPPPEDRARGRGGRFTVAPDTNDLDAFERVFFTK